MSCDRLASSHRRARAAALCSAAFASAALVSLGDVAPAWAQNSEPFYYSEEAAKIAGAVVARPGDSAALHYNPAGLAAIERARVSANGSVFGLRIRNFDDAFRTTFGSTNQSLDLRSTDIVAAPNALSAIFHVGAVTLSAGLFVTERDVRQASDDFVAEPIPAVPGGTLTERIELQTDLTKYDLGAGLGFHIAKNVRLGASLFATYRTQASIAQYAIGGDFDDGSFHESLSFNSVNTRVGLVGSVGLQVDASERVHLGLLLRSPELVMSSSDTGGGFYTFASSLPGEVESELEVLESTGVRAAGTVAEPFVATLGSMVEPIDGLELSAEVDFATGLDNPALYIDRSPNVNVRLGVRGQASRELVLGGGLFSDLSPLRELGPDFTNERIHWLGGTFGLSLLTPLALASRPDDEEGIVLSTTIAVRYAAGFGQARGFVFDDGEGQSPARDVLYHDVMPFFGSSVMF